MDNVYEVTRKLLGKIEPEGAAHIDGERYENLVKTINVTEKLIESIMQVARHKGRHEHSMSKSGETAFSFILGLRERVCDE